MEPEPVTIRVEGTVTAADDGSPVVGAEVVVVRIRFLRENITLATDSTDTSGRYSLSFDNTDCVGNFVAFSITHPDFFLKSIGVIHDPHVNCTEELQTIDVQLDRRLP